MTESTFPDLPSNRAYTRADVERYLAAAAERRAVLQTQIADAQERLERAGAVSAVLLDAHFELQRIRTNGERRAADIVAEADRRAEAIANGEELILPEESPQALDALGTTEYFEFLRGGLTDAAQQPLRLIAE